MSWISKLWANRAVERFVWTAAEAGVGILAAHFAHNVVLGFSVGAALLIVKEFIIAQLAKTNTP